LGKTDVGSHFRKVLDSQIEREGLPVGFGSSCHVITLLRHSRQFPCVAYESVAANPITVSELHGLPFTGCIAIAFCLMECVCASIKILKAVDEGSREP
jgi:hypothetical protein